MKSKTKNIISWLLSILLALAMFGAGVAKLAQVEQQVEGIRSWGLPAWTIYPIGLVEVILAIGLIIPRFRILSVFGMFIWSVVAIVTVIQATPPQYFIIPGPVLFSAVAAIILWLEKSKSSPGTAREAAGKHT